MANYNQHYLEAEKCFLQEKQSLQKESFEMKQELLIQMNKVSEKQDYLERIILEKAVTSK